MSPHLSYRHTDPPVTHINSTSNACLHHTSIGSRSPPGPPNPSPDPPPDTIVTHHHRAQTTYHLDALSQIHLPPPAPDSSST
ncbi:hypothetical protein CEXT_766341 [Caerostris extrusa]|uniref:Uncharacterized protein n=1 Tax=Caerostris extrusa TaxID=172846 RepID=A0AAV4UD37_CAEEX|nr:hypothetical protein CEXT_766341 [Caerostris extrusa]